MRRALIAALIAGAVLAAPWSAQAAHVDGHNPCGLDGHRELFNEEPYGDIVFHWGTDGYLAHSSSGGTSTLSRYIEADGANGSVEGHLEIRRSEVPEANRTSQMKVQQDGVCLVVLGQKVV